MRKLLILDMNGLFCYKVLTETEVKDDFFTVIPRKNMSICIIPSSINFLIKCNELFDIAIWTSGTYINLGSAVKYLSDQSGVSFVFQWYRDRCELDENYLLDHDLKPWSTIKNMRSVLFSPYVNAKRIYNEDNIIIADNTESKIRSFKNKIHIEELNTESRDIEYYNEFFDNLFERIKEYV